MALCQRHSPGLVSPLYPYTRYLRVSVDISSAIELYEDVRMELLALIDTVTLCPLQERCRVFFVQRKN